MLAFIKPRILVENVGDVKSLCQCDVLGGLMHPLSPEAEWVLPQEPRQRCASLTKKGS